jgi:hypothetical protein
MLEFIGGLQFVNPILMKYPSIAATEEVNHADILLSVFWTAQPQGNRFFLTEDTSRCTAKVVFATEFLHLTNQLTNSMEHSPWEANSISASQEILRILWNPKIYYRIQKQPAAVSILSQINPVRASPSYLLMIHFNIIVLSTPRSSQRALSLHHLSCLPYVTWNMLFWSTMDFIL